MQEDRIRMNVTAFLYYGTIAFEEHGAALFNLHEQTAVAAAQKKKKLRQCGLFNLQLCDCNNITPLRLPSLKPPLLHISHEHLLHTICLQKSNYIHDWRSAVGACT